MYLIKDIPDATTEKCEYQIKSLEVLLKIIKDCDIDCLNNNNLKIKDKPLNYVLNSYLFTLNSKYSDSNIRKEMEVDIRIINLLLQQGADLNHNLSLHFIFSLPWLCDKQKPGLYIKVIGYLIKNGVDPNKQDDEGRTPLHILSKTHGSRPYDNFTIPIAQLLVNAGADCNLKDKYGKKAVDYTNPDGQLRERFGKYSFSSIRAISTGCVFVPNILVIAYCSDSIVLSCVALLLCACAFAIVIHTIYNFHSNKLSPKITEVIVEPHILEQAIGQ